MIKMKKIVLFLLISLMSLSPAMILAEDYDVKLEGTKLIFNKTDNIEDVELSKFNLPFTFETQYVPQKAQFMIGKIYRGVFKGNQYRNMLVGYKIYLSPINWNKETAEFLVATYSSKTGSSQGIMTCPRELSSEFNCYSKRRGPSSGYYKFTIGDDKSLRIDYEDGWDTPLEEVGEFPKSFIVWK